MSLINHLQNRPPYDNNDDDDSVLDFDESDEGGPPKWRKRWWNYIPLCVLIALIFAPQYSVMKVLVSYFLKTRDSPFLFTVNLVTIDSLTFLACCSLMVCLVRDPGAVRVGENAQAPPESDTHGESDMSVTEALLMPATTRTADVANEDDDFNSPLKWCRKCWTPKPERAHHCSVCKRCVLKMDHHCPWLAQKCVLVSERLERGTEPMFLPRRRFCSSPQKQVTPSFLRYLMRERIGSDVHGARMEHARNELVKHFRVPKCVSLTRNAFRNEGQGECPTTPITVPAFAFIHTFAKGHWTYPAFLHFLATTTLLCIYVSLMSLRVTYVAFVEPFLVDEIIAIHALFLTLYCAIFAITVSSFLGWHLYLVSTNQTTLENLSPFLILRYLPIRPSEIQTATNDDEASSTNGSRQKRLSHIPREHQLSGAQRRHVQYAHGYIRLYDLGWRKNFGQVFGVGSESGRPRWRRWVYRAVCGGGSYGDGKAFPRNPKADTLLERLAVALADEDKLD